jgi:hypothetical protein
MEEPSTIHPQLLVQSMYELRLELRRRLKHFIGKIGNERNGPTFITEGERTWPFFGVAAGRRQMQQHSMSQRRQLW